MSRTNESYITHRTQYVHFVYQISQNLPAWCGVPQGSIIGPLLFLQYVNDISRSTPDILWKHSRLCCHCYHSIYVYLVEQINHSMPCLMVYVPTRYLWMQQKHNIWWYKIRKKTHNIWWYKTHNNKAFKDGKYISRPHGQCLATFTLLQSKNLILFVTSFFCTLEFLYY